jgi:hypothetical protein
MRLTRVYRSLRSAVNLSYLGASILKIGANCYRLRPLIPTLIMACCYIYATAEVYTNARL